MLTALKPLQFKLIDRASTMLIRESSDLDKVISGDAYSEANEPINIRALKRSRLKTVFKSRDSLDKRLISMVGRFDKPNRDYRPFIQW